MTQLHFVNTSFLTPTNLKGIIVSDPYSTSQKLDPGKRQIRRDRILALFQSLKSRTAVTIYFNRICQHKNYIFRRFKIIIYYGAIMPIKRRLFNKRMKDIKAQKP